MSLEALIFDVDGTLAETEETHRLAFNRAFENFGLDWYWSVDDYRKLLKTTGGKERIAAHIREIGYLYDVDIVRLHTSKTEIYVELVRTGNLELRPGVKALLEHAKASGLRLAIATTTSRPNVDQLLLTALGDKATGWFDVIACGGDVNRKKPDPAVYVLALEKLGLKANQCVAFEDSIPGLQSAIGAGLSTIVTPSLYTFGDDFTGASLVIENLEKPFSYLEMESMNSTAGLTPDLRDLLLRHKG